MSKLTVTIGGPNAHLCCMQEEPVNNLSFAFFLNAPAGQTAEEARADMLAAIDEIMSEATSYCCYLAIQAKYAEEYLAARNQGPEDRTAFWERHREEISRLSDKHAYCYGALRAEPHTEAEQ